MRRALTLAAVLVLAAGCSHPAQHLPRPTPVPSAGVSASCRLGPNARPDPVCTPGATNHAVTQATITRTICVPGWTATVRPPLAYTARLKVAQIRSYGFADTNVAHYEEDHLIPLELGGAPRDPHNLWPEAHSQSATKDRAENQLKSLVCRGAVTLADAQAEMLASWGPAQWTPVPLITS